MTREELFRAVGEVREDQIAEAETGKKQGRPWKRYGVLAACLAVVLTAGFALDRLRPAEERCSGQADAGIVENSSLDGSYYSAPEDAPAGPSIPWARKLENLPGRGTGIGRSIRRPAWPGWSRRKFSRGTR